MEFENKAEEIKSKVTIYDILGRYYIYPNRANMIVCPFHKDSNASVKIYDNNTFHCFGCGADGDIFEFVQKMENCDFKQALEIIGGSTYTTYTPPKQEKKKKYVDGTYIKEYINRCRKNLNKTTYFEKRGINHDTQMKFCLGFDEKYNSIVIPYNKELTYYQSRNIETKKFYKPNIDIAGQEPFFNQNVLMKPECVFVVESPLCALSIEQCGYNAIAICGTQGWKRVPTTPMNDKCRLILCLDNDFEGRKAQRQLQEALPDKCIAFNIADECKDINDLLMKEPERLQKNLDQIVSILNKYYYGGMKDEI